MQLIKRSDSALPTGNDVYAIVKKVWQNSIQVAEKLLAGECYRTSTSEPLLALSAWHLYPDMAILSPNTADVLQEDPLFHAGGILTLGMSTAGSQSENGITWSLPLSHLRFYGKPVTKTRSLGLESERIDFEDLKYMVLGTVTGHWFTKSGGLSKVLDFMNALMNCLRPQCHETSDCKARGTNSDPETSHKLPEWLELLWQAVAGIQESQGQLRSDREQLYYLGHRRGSKFLSASEKKVPEAFGLANFETFLDQYGDHEEKINTVRKLLPTLVSDSSLLQEGFISYRVHRGVWRDSSTSGTHAAAGDKKHFHTTHADYLTVGKTNPEEFATIVPLPPLADRHGRRVPSFHMKNNNFGRGTIATHTFTWEVSCMLSPASAQVHRRADLIHATGEQAGLYVRPVDDDSMFRTFSVEDNDTREKDLDSDAELTKQPVFRNMENPFIHSPPEILQKSSANWGRAIRAAQADRGFGSIGRETKYPVAFITGFGNDGSVTFQGSHCPTSIRQAPPFWSGARKSWWNSAYTTHLPGPAPRLTADTHASSSVPFCLRLRDAADGPNILAEDMGCPHKYYIASPVEAGTTCKYSLVAGDGSSFGVWFPTQSVYQLQGVPFDEIMKALEQHAERKLLMSRLQSIWDDKSQDYMVSLDAFASATSIFKNLPETTISLSVTNRPLFTAKWFSHKPYNLPLERTFSCLTLFETGSIDIHPDDLADVMAMSAGNSLFMAEYIFNDPSNDSDTLVRRTIGNIGKPGVAFLLSAQGLDSLTLDYSNWKSIQHAPYNGKLENNFDQTTLHLTLTGDEQPLNIGQTGYHDKEVFLVEAVVRAYDKSRWVADLDIKLRPRTRFQTLDELECAHDELERDDYSAFKPVTSIDSWDELLDPPQNTGVVRAKANWLARQAVAAFALQQSRPLIVASGVICWGCVAEVMKTLSTTKGVKSSSNLLIVC